MTDFCVRTFGILFILCNLAVTINSQTTVVVSPTSAPTGSSIANDPAYENINTTPVNGGDSAEELSSGNCTLEYPPEAVEQFKELLDKIEEAIFVYFKLNFSVEFESDMAYLSENATDVIDPLTWIWSKGGRGELLLSSPFDFIHLSFGTLKPGVYTMDLELQASSRCLSDGVSDADKLDSLATTLLELTAKAADELDKEPIACRDLEEEEDEDEATSVCLEKQLGPDQFDVVGVYAFPSVSYTILQGSTVFECWTATEGKAPRSNAVTTQSWLHWLLAGGILLALFSPLALNFFIRKHPPFKDRRNLNERFMLVTDPIPAGFKYAFFHWKEDIPWFHFVRWVVIILFFGFIQYVPLVVTFATDSDGLSKRIAAVYRVGLIDQTTDTALHVIINLFYFIISFILLGIYVSPKGHKFLIPFLRERDLQDEDEDEQQVGEEDQEKQDQDGNDNNGNVDAEKGGKSDENSQKHDKDDNNEEPNLAYKHFVILETPEELWTPDTILPNARAFLFIMLYRVKMAFDPCLWQFCVDWLWRTITSCCGAPSSGRPVLCAILFAIVFPFYLIFFVFLLCFNSLPLFYCLTRAFQTISNEVRPSEILFLVSVLIIAVAWFCKFVGIFTYIAELLGYTFVGFVANAEIVGPICLVVVVFIGYFVSAVTDFYDIYCKLFREVVEAAEEVDKEIQEMVKDGDNTDSGITADTLKEGVLYRKKLKPAKSFAWEKDNKDDKKNKKADKKKKKGNDEQIEMTVASSESATSGTVDIPPSPTPSSELLSTEDQEVLRLVSKPGFGSLVTYNKKGTPAIESKLFWMAVEKYCPLRGKAAAAVVQLSTLAVVIALGMTILSIVDGFRDLPATVEFFGSVIVAGVIPIFLVAMRSPEAQECYDEAIKRQLRVDVRSYALFGQFESMAL